MITELRQIAAEAVEADTKPEDWRKIKRSCFFHSYLIFLTLSVYRLCGKAADLQEIFSAAGKLGLAEQEILACFKNMPDAGSVVDRTLRIAEKNKKWDLHELYQSFIASDFQVQKKSRIRFINGKNGRDVLGAYYTNEDFAYEITKRALDQYIDFRHPANQYERNQILMRMKILDNSCGGGEFLLAVIRYYKNAGMEEGRIAKTKLCGYDVDPVAVLITRTRIALELKTTKVQTEIKLGNPLIAAEKETEIYDKFIMAADGRYYNPAMAVLLPDQSFDLILGNPPWEKVRFEDKKFLRHFTDEEEKISGKKDREDFLKSAGADNIKFYNHLKGDYLFFKSYIKTSGRFYYTIKGELNTYALFTELNLRLVRKSGMIGLIVKTSMFKMAVYHDFFEELLRRQVLWEIYMFTNKKKIFHIDSREEFSVIYLTEQQKEPLKAALNLEDFKNFAESPKIELSKEMISMINPATGMLPNISKDSELSFLCSLYEKNNTFEQVYPYCRYGRLVHLTNHAEHIVKEQREGYLPVYEGKFIELYTEKFATFRGMSAKEKYANKASAVKINDLEGKEYPESRYFIEEKFWNRLSRNFPYEYFIAWRSLTSATNQRTMLATILPKMPTCQSIQFLQVGDAESALQILALFNSVVFDYIVRLKMAGLDLTQTIIKQIPVPSKEKFAQKMCYQGVTAPLGQHINSRIKYLYRNDDRAAGIFQKAEGYLLPREKERKEVIAEIDWLISQAYSLTEEEMRMIVEAFPKYYIKEEAGRWF